MHTTFSNSRARLEEERRRRWRRRGGGAGGGDGAPLPCLTVCCLTPPYSAAPAPLPRHRHTLYAPGQLHGEG
ncbi:hypothetical protein E2C01_025865 [Portunus trituberculatus]|uniref:Uncharacterized protein n=1 Tax=Portunus trituberculatus TaxID=210409 RepID=A0A5B7EEG3_PORTR|nr:hypothetical protein [Portunus trituberculatus]